MCFPAGVGMPLSPTKRHHVLEIHYDNPNNEKGFIDTSGLTLHMVKRSDSTLGEVRSRNPQRLTYSTPSSSPFL